MIFNQNILLDYTFDDSVSEKDCHLNWQEFADDDYVQMELTQNDRVIMVGDTTHDLILMAIDNFLRGVVFGTQEEAIVTRGIKTPNNYYECETEYIRCRMMGKKVSCIQPPRKNHVFEIEVNNSNKQQVLDKINETRLTEEFFRECRDVSMKLRKDKTNGTNIR